MILKINLIEENYDPKMDLDFFSVQNINKILLGGEPINKIIKMPHYIDNGCYKFLDHKRQVIFYVRNSHNKITVETIIKTNPIQMLRNMCDAHRMLCEQKYHKKNKCRYCKLWTFNNICRDNLFGTCKRGKDCKFNHIKMP